MLAGRLVLTGLLAVMAALLWLAQTRVIVWRKDAEMHFVWAVLLGVLVWLPRWMREIFLWFLVWLLAVITIGPSMMSAVLGAVVVLLLAWGTGRLPGGVSVIVCAIVAVGALFEVRGALRGMRRQAAAASLRPGEQPRGEVWCSGTVRGEGGAEPPPTVPEQACFWAWKSLDFQVASPAPFEIVTPHGVVRVFASGMQLELESAKTLSDEDTVLIDRRAKKGNQAELLVLKPGQAASVIGTPSWEPGGSGAALYRESPMIPVFRGAQEATLYDRDAVAVHKGTLSAMTAWLGWGAAAVAVAVMQLVGAA